ncbi:MAG: diaminobutyrate--2-oxoglutarate transaminase, partial [Dehalococcoidia bacterium]
GMIQGLKSDVPGFAGYVAQEAFERGLIIETSGPESQVIKLLPALTIETQTLQDGISILRESVQAVAAKLLSTPEPAQV